MLTSGAGASRSSKSRPRWTAGTGLTRAAHAIRPRSRSSQKPRMGKEVGMAPEQKSRFLPKGVYELTICSAEETEI